MIRLTESPTAFSNEDLLFDTSEMLLGASAVLYTADMHRVRVAPSITLLGFEAICGDPLEAVIRSDYLAAMTFRAQTLERKFEDGLNSPEEPMEVTPQDIKDLGEALFYLSHSACANAIRAVETGQAKFEDERAKRRSRIKIRHVENTCFGLFKLLEPIAKEKEDIVWRRWERWPANRQDLVS